MPEQSLINKIQHVFRIFFREDDLVISERTTAADIDSWDSLNHIGLIVELENYFGVTFTFDEVSSFNNVGDMAVCIAKKQAK